MSKTSLSVACFVLNKYLVGCLVWRGHWHHTNLLVSLLPLCSIRCQFWLQVSPKNLFDVKDNLVNLFYNSKLLKVPLWPSYRKSEETVSVQCHSPVWFLPVPYKQMLLWPPHCKRWHHVSGLAARGGVPLSPIWFLPVSCQQVPLWLPHHKRWHQRPTW